MDEPAICPICPAVADNLLCKDYRLPLLSLVDGLNTIGVIGRDETVDCLSEAQMNDCKTVPDNALYLLITVHEALKINCL